MDPLSDVLSLLRLRTSVSFGFDAGGAWSIAFGAHDGIKFYAGISGEGWLAVDGVAAPVHARAGDCLMLLRGRGFRIASDLALPSIDGATALPAKLDGVTRINGGGELYCVGGYFELTGDYASVLREMLPPIVHLRTQEDRAMLCWCGDRMRWRWTLESLARQAGMSRTSFALRFKHTVGMFAMDYLTRWRMLLAGDRLATTGDPISVLAPSLGYESESAFSTAFKRVMGCSPRQYVASHRS